jgi:hypothetical protein
MVGQSWLVFWFVLSPLVWTYFSVFKVIFIITFHTLIWWSYQALLLTVYL